MGFIGKNDLSSLRTLSNDHSKAKEVWKSVLAEMLILAHLYLQFKHEEDEDVPFSDTKHIKGIMNEMTNFQRWKVWHVTKHKQYDIRDHLSIKMPICWEQVSI